MCYYDQKKFSVEIRTGSLIILTAIFEFGLPPLLNSKMTGTSWAELAQRGSDVEVATKQNKHGNFLMHSERCESSQDSFLQF